MGQGLGSLKGDDSSAAWLSQARLAICTVGGGAGSMGHHQPPEPRAAVAARPKPAFGWRSAVLVS